MKKDENFMPGLSTPEHVVYHVDLGDTPPEDVIEALRKAWEQKQFPKRFNKKG